MSTAARSSTTSAWSLARLYTKAKERALSGARRAKRRGISVLSFLLRDPQHFRLVYLHTFWSELCNLYWRMEILRSARLHRCGIGLLIPSQQRQKQDAPARDWQLIRKTCMQKILAIHPRATLIDLYLVTTIAHDLFAAGCHMGGESSCDTLLDSHSKVAVPLHNEETALRTNSRS
jgi:hypothetical protein